MKTLSVLLFVALLLGFASCSKDTEEISLATAPQNVTPFQKYMLDEINFARTNPTSYAELRLKDAYTSSTDNGSYVYLTNLTAVGSVSFNSSLNQAAQNYAIFLAEKNLAEHNADGTPLKRAIRAGYTGSSTGENLVIASANSYNAIINPQTAAIDFVKVMIIDQGVEDLGHRIVLLNTKYRAVGIGFTRNSSTPTLNYVVQDFGNE